MRAHHQHVWNVATLEDDYIPGIPTWVTRCACGQPKPTVRPAQAAGSAA